MLLSSCCIQHWDRRANQALQELRQPVTEVRLLAGHVHGTRPGAPPAPAQQQAEGQQCTHRQDKPAGLRAQAQVRPRDTDEARDARWPHAAGMEAAQA